MPLRSTPLRSTGWADVLRGTALANTPLTAITLDDVFKLNSAAVDALTLDDIDLASSPLRSTSLGALMLGDLTARQAGLPAGGLCAVLAPDDASCDSGALADQSLTELELAGYDLTPYFRLGLPLPTTGLAGTPLGRIALSDVRLAATPLGDVPASVLGGAVTLGDALSLLAAAGRPEPSLAALLVGIVPADELPLGLVPLSDLLRRAPLRTADLVTTSVSFTLDCSQAGGLRVEVPVPDGLRFAPGSAHTGAGTGVADPSNSGGTLVFDSLRDGRPLSALCDDETAPQPNVRLAFQVEPPASTGTLLLRASVSVANGEGDADSTTLDVNDGHDAGATPAGAQAIHPDNARTGYIASPTDIDTYALDAPAPGSRVTVTLTHLPADYDVSVLGPPTGLDAVRASPLRSTPLRSTPLLDQGDEPGADPRTLAPQTLQDAPLRSTVLDSTPLRSTSFNRSRADESSTFVVESTDAGGRFYVQVAGHNGATSPSPYLLDVNVVAPVDPPACVGRRTLPSVPAGSLPGQPLDPATQTLFLVDQQRTIGLFGQAAYDTMRAELNTAAGLSHGAVLAVDGDPAVRAAYAALDADRCSADAANHVAEAINHVVDQQRSGLTGLRHIVIVGGDDVIPQVRVRDLVSVSNEREEADDLVLNNHDSAISRALRDGYVLSDDPYGDFDPQSWLSGQLFVPDVALGRLVETPDEILGQLKQFDDAGGVLKPQEARVAGYDFLTDGAHEVLDQLAPAVGGHAVDEINDTWDASTAIDTIRRASAAFTSINAHYDQHRALPASAFNANGAPDLVLAGDATPAPGSVLFTMGCHAGLSLPDSGVLDHVPTATDAANADPSLLDWAQQFARNRSVFVGNTGYGYGDTTSVAWSERIMSLLAGQLAGGKVTVGQALMFAKQRFIADSGVPGVYDAKASEEATFYGLPMYRIGDAGAQGASVIPTVPSGGTTLRSKPFSVDPSFVRKNDPPRGSHWEVEGEAPQVSHFRPIQPRTSFDVTADDGLPAHGALVEDLSSSDLGDIDPEYARPTIDLSANEPEVAARSDVFPAAIQRVSSLGTPDGIKDRLVLIAGQFITDPSSPTGRGTQRLFGHIAGEVLRSDSTDYEPPALRNITGELGDAGATFTVETPDDDATRGVVLYRDDTAGSASTWRRADLTQTASGVFTASGAVAPGATEVVEYTVQLADAAGNVSVASNKGPGYRAQAAPPPSDAQATIDVSPQEPASGFFRSTPTISLGAVDPRGYQYRVDGGDFQPYTGPFTLGGDGTRVITVRAPDGTIVKRTVRVDGSAPLLADTPDPAWTSADTAAELSATDPVGGSGVESLTYHATAAQAIPETTVAGDHASVPVTTEGITEFTYTATDRAGNESAPGTLRVRIDRTDPTAQADVAPAPHGGWNRDDATVHITGADGGSGVDALLVSATGAQPFAQRELAGAAGDVTITAAGVTTLTYRARDAAGRTSAPQTIVVRIDRAAPSAAHAFAPATPASGWYAGPADVTLSATDPAGGSGVDALHYSATGAQPIAATDVAGDHATVHVTREGITQVRTTATDVAGNPSAPDTATVKLDATAPSAHHTVTPAPNAAGWNRTAPTLTLSAADDAGAADASGVESIAYQVTGAGGSRTATVAGSSAAVPVTAQGVTTVTYTARDRAGNVSHAGSAVVRYDATAPATTAASLSPAPNAAGWNTGPVTATLGGSDSASGVAQVVYSATGAQPIARTVADGATAAPRITREGITTLTWTVRDAAGNESAPRTLIVRIDATRPTITCAPTPAFLWPMNLELVPVKVAVSVKDGGSGPAGFTLRSVDSNGFLLLNVVGFRPGTSDTTGWLRAIGTLFTREDRTYTLTYQGVDVAGNTATCNAVVTVAKPPKK